MNGVDLAAIVAAVSVVVWLALRADGWLREREARRGWTVSEATRLRLAEMRAAEERSVLTTTGRDPSDG